MYTHYINPSLKFATAPPPPAFKLQTLLMFTSYIDRQTDVHSTNPSLLFVFCYFILDTLHYPLQTSVPFNTVPGNHIWMSNSRLFIYISKGCLLVSKGDGVESIELCSHNSTKLNVISSWWAVPPSCTKLIKYNQLYIFSQIRLRSWCFFYFGL